MWKFAIYATIFYLIVLLISKIFDKRKVKKYGRDVVIGRVNRDDDPSDDGNGNAGTDKQQPCNDRNDWEFNFRCPLYFPTLWNV